MDLRVWCVFGGHVHLGGGVREMGWDGLGWLVDK